ncbi:MAG: sigma-70 family RNA polymerase sigma factor [Alphaproteobacteria bacterium]|nr:sigma-70 family RNA polymerase sigma factor [Alphaproteobacteria bacterium]
MSSRVTGQTLASLADASDDTLLRIIGGADRKAATGAGAELVNRHLSYMVHICRQKLGNQAEAEEAAQDVFLSVWKNAANWQSGNAKVTTWLYRIATNRCIDILRRRKPTTDIDAIAEPADERENIEAAQMEADRNRQLRAALDALTADQKQAIELVYYRETKQADAATQMGITLAALESLLRRARSKLNEELTPFKDHLELIK